MKLVSVRRMPVAQRRILVSSLLLAASVLAAGSAARATPVIPGAAGYGMDTAAGRGGVIYKVTNLNASGSGSLKACIDGTAARVCVFEVSGTIRITEDLMIRNSRITIAGQTAPSPGIMLRGAALRIQASDVLVQHIRVRAGDDPNGPDPANRDSLKIEGSDAKPVRNIVIDHCSLSWAVDEVASVWGPFDNITFSNNIFSEPLNESIHPTDDGRGIEKHGFGVIVGSVASGGRITMTGNLFAHTVERNPLSRARELVFVNNVIYDRGTMDVDLQSERGRVTRSSVAGNVMVRGPSYSRDTRPIFLRTSGTNTLVSGARVYVHDNLESSGVSSVAQMVTFTGGDVLASLLQMVTAPVWNSGLVARSTAGNAVYNRVLAFAGARPHDRDSVDKRVVQSVKDRNGRIINCVSANGSTRCAKNAGGWPALAVHTRKLTLPSSPGSMTSNGYTRLENWLHSLDESVAGTVQANSPAQPPSLSVQ